MPLEQVDIKPKDNSHFFGYSTTSLSNFKNHLNLLDDFFCETVSENYFIFGDYDVLSRTKMNADFDLLARKFSKFYITRAVNKKYQTDNFLTYSNWVNLLFDNCIDNENLYVIGLIRVKLSESDDIGADKNFIYELKKILKTQNFNESCVKIYESHSWDDFQIFIETNSISTIFSLTREVNRISIGENHLVNKTETTVGFKTDLFFKPMKQIENFIDDTDKIGFSIEGVSVDTFSVETNIQHLSQYLDTYRTAGKVDFFLYPKTGKSSYLLSSRKIIDTQLKICKHIIHNDLKLNISTTVYQKLLVEENNVNDGYTKSNKELLFSQETLLEFYESLKKFKTPTPERSSIIFLINNYNRYVSDSIISKRITQLTKPINTFINDINSLSKEEPINYSPYEISSRLKNFTKALEHAIENILHSSPRFEKTNDIFITTKCSLSQALSSYDRMSKVLTELIGVEGFFVHFDYDCHLKITDQSLNLNLYNIIKPELFCSLIGAEIFNLYIQDYNYDIDSMFNNDNNFFRLFSELSNRGDSLKHFTKVIKGSLMLQTRLQLNYIESSPLEFINEYFIDHVYMDLFNYYFFFDENKELYGFWYWACFLMDYKKFDSNLEIDKVNLKTRMLRYNLVNKIISKNNKNPKEKVLYPFSYSNEELPFENHYIEINNLIETLERNKIIQKWMSQVIDVFDHIGESINFNDEKFFSYKTSILKLLHGIYNSYNSKYFHFSNSGALVLNKGVEVSEIEEINLIRSQFLSDIISIN